MALERNGPTSWWYIHMQIFQALEFLREWPWDQKEYVESMIETEPNPIIPFHSPSRYEVPTAWGARDGAESGKDRGSQLY